MLLHDWQQCLMVAICVFCFENDNVKVKLKLKLTIAISIKGGMLRALPILCCQMEEHVR
jgi:hypothetical protein